VVNETIQEAFRQYRELGLLPEDPTLRAAVLERIVREEAGQAETDLDDAALDLAEKRSARVRAPLPAGV